VYSNIRSFAFSVKSFSFYNSASRPTVNVNCKAIAEYETNVSRAYVRTRVITRSGELSNDLCLMFESIGSIASGEQTLTFLRTSAIFVFQNRRNVIVRIYYARSYEIITEYAIIATRRFSRLLRNENFPESNKRQIVK